MKIDFVSDVSCPWCAIGLHALEQALDRLSGELGETPPELHFQPFELNPRMGPDGQDITEHLIEKYQLSEDQVAANRDAIRQRGEAVGFKFDMQRRGRIYNTFDAHRLLHWADEVGAGHQRALKHALFKAYFTDGENPSDPAVLVRLAAEAGLDPQRARAILDGDDYAEAVRADERHYLDAGIHAVPAVIVNDRYLIQGGQPAEVFEASLRRIAAEAAG